MSPGNKLYRITKLRSVDKPFHSNSTFGESSDYHLGYFTKEPVIGERFILMPYGWKPGYIGINTSPVTKIISDTKFETLNSVYEYEIYKD